MPNKRTSVNSFGNKSKDLTINKNKQQVDRHSQDNCISMPCNDQVNYNLNSTSGITSSISNSNILH